jgi:hypothetical protein
MNLRKIHQLVGIGLVSLTLNGCDWVYRPDIQQGNIMTDTQIAQLRQGMTIGEVKKLFGTPVLEQTGLDELEASEKTALLGDGSSELGDEDEEDEKDLMKIEYVYFYQPGYGKSTRKRISLTFEDEKLVKFRVTT